MNIVLKRKFINKLMWHVIFWGIQFALLCPEFITFTSAYNYIRYIHHVICVCSIVVFFVFFRKNELLWLILLFFFLFLFVTMKNAGNLGNFLLNFERSYSLICFYCFFYRMSRRLFFIGTSFFWMSLILVNTILTFLYPNGLYFFNSQFSGIDKSYYFLGVSNQVIPFYMISIVFVFLKNFYLNKNNKEVFLLFICMWGCEFVYQSATSLVGCFFFTIGYLFLVLPKDTQGKIVHSIHRGYNFILVAMAITVFMIHYLIVVYQIQNKFAYLVEVVLKKDLTFSTRTIIWNSAINMIEKSFLIGYGAVENNNRYIEIGSSSFNAHNIILQILLMGGIILLLVCFLLVWKSIKSMLFCLDLRVKNIVFLLFAVFFFMSLSEVYTLNLMFIVLYLGFLIKEKIPYCKHLDAESFSNNASIRLNLY